MKYINVRFTYPFHNAQVVDGHVALPDDLVAKLPPSFFSVLVCVGCAAKENS